MKNKIIAPAVLFVVVLIFSFVALSQGKKNNQSGEDIILYYGEGCPHCEIVDKYIEENNIESKVSFIRKEVYRNKENQEDLVTKARTCGFDDDGIGVPFLYDGEKCLIGDQDIINFFKEKIGG